MDNSCKKPKLPNPRAVLEVSYWKSNVGEEYSMFQMKSKTLDVPDLVDVFCHHCCL